MTHRLAADLIVLAHLLFVAFVALGGLLVLWRRRVALLHLPCVAWGAAVELGGWVCPLTPLEQQLRRAAGESGYAVGFIDHYIMPLIYPAGLSRGTQVALGILVVVVNTILYAHVLRTGSAGRRDRTRHGPGPPRR